MANTRNRKYLITINNPADHGLDRQAIIDICHSLNAVYFCLSEEIGIEEKTPHIHIFIIFKNARSFNAIREAFKGVAHIDKCYGTNEENRDYVFKEGKWLNDVKADTNLRDTHYEYGELPENDQGKRTDQEILVDLIDQGLTENEIIEQYPKYAYRLKNIRELIALKMQNKYSTQFRDIRVIYIYGPSRTGKTSYVFNKHGYKNVCRVSDYQHPFDLYEYQPVILFDEFNSSIPIENMLQYLEGYPCVLPCRFSNKQACYTTVYIVSNIPFDKQYEDVDKARWIALTKRFERIMEFDKEEKIVFNGYDLFEKGIGISLAEYEEMERGGENELKLA